MKPRPDQVPPIRIEPWRIRFADFFSWFQGLLFGHPPGRWFRRRITRRPLIVQVPIALRRGGPGLDGMTIAFLSDLHAGVLTDEADLFELFDRVNGHRPDLVVFGGDLIDHEPKDVRLYTRPLGRLNAPLGLFAVPGNHEYHREGGIDLWRETLEAAGVTVLLNRGVEIERGGDRLWLGGIDNLGRGTADVPAAIAGWQEDGPAVLISHEPDAFEDAAAAGVDLTLAGHTHGGQVVFGPWTPIHHSEHGWWRGGYERDGSLLHVGRGVGYSMVPIRIGSPAEVLLVRLKI